MIKSHRNHCAILCMFVLVGLTSLSEAGLTNRILNPSFETIPGPQVGEGLMPSDWTVVWSTPDTYSEDGSFGIPPEYEGNFTGVTAIDGIRWVAGWSTADERFGQTLSRPLIPRLGYTLSGYMIRARIGVHDHPGGYEVYLIPTATSPISTGVLLGALGPTRTASNDWEYYSFSFLAPENAKNLMFLLFKPFDDTTGGAYPGLDRLTLKADWKAEYGMLFDNPADIDLFRAYRDQVLNQSLRGRLYTHLLYLCSEQALEVLTDNPGLLRQAAVLVASHKNAVAAVLKGDEGVIEHSDRVIAFVERVAGKSPPVLKMLAELVAKGMENSRERQTSFLGFMLR